MEKKVVAIVLAAGQGKRMGSAVPKQYLLIEDKPVLYYTLKAFEESNVDEVIVVVGKDEIDLCRTSIIEAYQFSKVGQVVVGGNERYESVYYGLQSIDGAEYILIHDGARPCVTPAMINDTIMKVQELKACVVGVPCKDTIKMVDCNQVVVDTPDRSRMWQVQTPQAFEFHLIKNAYDKLIKQGITSATDDAMVVETMEQHTVTMIAGDYRNIKVTTPEDLHLAQLFLKM